MVSKYREQARLFINNNGVGIKLILMFSGQKKRKKKFNILTYIFAAVCVVVRRQIKNSLNCSGSSFLVARFLLFPFAGECRIKFDSIGENVQKIEAKISPIKKLIFDIFFFFCCC
jgi:hypothetical protein